ncbi:TerD family protein [Spirulina sp. CS-785/01]|uniref:TerD family protein n=1 Tax=Spirulina sp. CS-785/01 TaxID=3021716 RepID=UPI00232FBE70|nr:TerD family protein [Spirulina sp. CS-785/01]MDB9315243.1 TerD family protein [Spirulina sp. CS-785/01]
MSINLKKGQRISLVKEAPGLKRVLLGLGWDVAESKGGILGLFSGQQDYDLDSSVLCLDAQGKLKNRSNLIYFGNLRHSSGAITHLGDNLTGAGEGDDEQIVVDLPQMPADFHKLIFVVNIYKSQQRNQDFSHVNNAFVRLVNLETNQEIAQYNLSGGSYDGMTGMIMAELYREGDDWQMQAVGEGIQVQGLQEIERMYS